MEHHKASAFPCLSLQRTEITGKGHMACFPYHYYYYCCCCCYKWYNDIFCVLKHIIIVIIFIFILELASLFLSEHKMEEFLSSHNMFCLSNFTLSHGIHIRPLMCSSVLLVQHCELDNKTLRWRHIFFCLFLESF